MSSIYLNPEHTVKKRIGEKLTCRINRQPKGHRRKFLPDIRTRGFTQTQVPKTFMKKWDFQVAGLLHEGGYKFGKYHDVRMYEHRLGSKNLSPT